jgi:hypothetical protein
MRRHSLERTAFALGALALLSGTAAAGQALQHEARVVNVAVPVRVFQGNRFVDSLAIGDFEVTDNGQPRKLEAVYLVKKANIERREETRKFAPRTARNFFLFFELGEFEPRLLEALEYFVTTAIIPGDELTLVTPMKTYKVNSRAFERANRHKVYEDIVALVRRDILIGYSESREIVEEMKSLSQVMASLTAARATAVATSSMPPDLASPPTTVASSTPALAESTFTAMSFQEQLQNYLMLLERLQNLRVVDPMKFAEFARYLKMLNGQKEIFIFYQREFVPKIDPKILSVYMNLYNDQPEVTQTLTSLFEFYKRDSSLDVAPLKRAYSDSSTAVHFMYIAKPPPKPEGVLMEEQSEDVFAPFLELAKATGGFTGSSANLLAMMRSAVEAAENYYVLYYRPEDYVADGKFHDLTVKVKGGNYRITHRAGYIAD